MEEIHEPTGDEELTIDLDFGSNHDLSSRPDPIHSKPLVNKKPLTETKSAPNNKSLADTVSKLKSKEKDAKKRKSLSLGIFDENLNDREKSPKKKNLKKGGKISNVIIKQEVIELSSDEDTEPEKAKLGAKRHLTVPSDTPSKKQRLEKELTVAEYCDVFEKMSNFVGKRQNTPIFQSVALKRHLLPQSTKSSEILKNSEEKHKSELRIRRKNEHHSKLLDFSKAKSIFAGRNQTGAERRAEIISDLDQQIKNQKQIDYQYRLKKSDFEDSKRFGRGDKEGHEIKTKVNYVVLEVG